MDREILSEFIQLLGEECVREQEPMARHTSFRIGGPAAFFLTPKSESGLAGAIKICREADLPFSDPSGVIFSVPPTLPGLRSDSAWSPALFLVRFLRPFPKQSVLQSSWPRTM